MDHSRQTVNCATNARVGELGDYERFSFLVCDALDVIAVLELIWKTRWGEVESSEEKSGQTLALARLTGHLCLETGTSDRVLPLFHPGVLTTKRVERWAAV